MTSIQWITWGSVGASFLLGAWIPHQWGDRQTAQSTAPQKEALAPQSTTGQDASWNLPTSIDEFLDHWIQSRDSTPQLQGALFARWVDRDPVHALNHLSQIRPEDKPLFLAGLFYAWAKKDAESAFQHAQSLTKADRKLALEQIALAAPLTPFAIMADLTTKDDAELIQRHWEWLSDPWKKKDSATLSPGIHRKLVQLLSEAKFSNDVSEALQWVASLPTPTDKQLALERAATSLANRNQPDRLKLVFEAHPHLRKNMAIARATTSALARTEGREAAVQWLTQYNSNNVKIGGFDELLSQSVRAIPEETTALFDQLNQMTSTGLPYQELLAQGVAQVDPRGALNWLEFGSYGFMSGAGSNVAKVWAEAAPTEALEHLRTIEDPYLMRDFAHGLGQHFGKSDPAAGIEWSQSVGDDLSDKVVLGIVSQWAKHTPDGAASYIGSIEDQVLAKDLTRTLVREWSIADPAATAAWVSSQSPEKVDQRTVDDLTYNWCQTDPHSASEWINTMPAGERRDHGSYAISLAMMNIDSQAAVSWAMQITDEQVRGRAVGRVFSHLATRGADPSEFLNEASDSLTDTELQILQSYLDNP